MIGFSALVALACDGGAPTPDAGDATDSGAAADAATPVPDGGPDPLVPGTVDPSFGESGLFDLELGGGADLLVPTEAGIAVAASQQVWLLDASGAVQAHHQMANVQRFRALFPLADGGWLALIEFFSFTRFLRLDASFAIDETFSAEEALEGISPASAARDPESGAIYVAATRSDGGVDRVVVRKLGADGALDTSFGTGGTAVGALEDVEQYGALRLLPDGKLAVLCTDGFTPCVVRFEGDGTPDASFGDGGGVVLDSFGPRYPRALELDSQGRMLVLGMSSSAIQLARLADDGSLDASFGDSGMVELDVTRPLSPDYDETVEARALAVQPDGKLVVVASFTLDEPQDGTDDDDELLLVRFTPDGELDPSFGGEGWTRLDIGGDRTRTYAGRAIVQGERLYIAAEHLRDEQWWSFATAIAL